MHCILTPGLYKKPMLRAIHWHSIIRCGLCLCNSLSQKSFRSSGLKARLLFWIVVCSENDRFSTHVLVKLAEDSEEIIVRMYESFGGRSTAVLHCKIPIQRAVRCNILEQYWP